MSETVMFMSQVLAATVEDGGSGLPGGLAGVVGLLNYGVLGVITVGFIRGWVVSPKERDRLVEDVELLRKQLVAESADHREQQEAKDAEIARLNSVMQEQLQAMVSNTDKQIELWSRRLDQRIDRGGGDGGSR